MKAIITEKPGKFNINHRKEDNFQKEICVLEILPDSVREVVTMRQYGTKAKNYVCLWVHCEHSYRNGSGSAGGYGYHRPSAAAEEAIKNAGITLDEPIGGVGDSAMREACLAIAEAVSPHGRFYLHEAFG